MSSLLHQRRMIQSRVRHLMNDQPVDYEPVDHISSLPDAVLFHILSLIPTKSAVMTSILSRRWKCMWTKVPLLDFTEMPSSTTYNDLTRQQKVSFRSFVDRALLHNAVSYICCLRLHFLILDDDGDFYFKSWVGAITRREIREIDISLAFPRGSKLVPLPERFLSCERLVVLKLEGDFAIDVPTSLHLPNLEIVHFTGVHFPNDEFMKRLSLGCCVLKELYIKSCAAVSTLYVASSTLKTLKIIHNWAKNRLLACVVKAPNLMCLHIGVIATQVSCDICDQNSLVEANLDIKGYGVGDNEYIAELVSKVSGVNTLELGSSSICGRMSNPPIFSNLTSLRLHVVDENALKILKCAPKLKYLILTVVKCWDYIFESESELLSLSCLEHVEFDWFLGEEEEMRLVAYLLKAAPLLKEMKIIMRDYLKEPRREIYEGLLMLPRSSTACQVKVIHKSDC